MINLSLIEQMIFKINDYSFENWNSIIPEHLNLQDFIENDPCRPQDASKQLFLRDHILYRLHDQGIDYDLKQVNKDISNGKVKLNKIVCKNHIAKLNQKDVIEYDSHVFIIGLSASEDELQKPQVTNPSTLSQSSIENIIIATLLDELNKNRTEKGNPLLNNLFNDSLSSNEVEAITATLIKMLNELSEQKINSSSYYKYFKFLDKHLSSIYKKLSLTEKSFNSQKLSSLANQQKEILYDLKNGIEALQNLNDIKSYNHTFKNSIYKTESKFLVKPFFDSELINHNKINSLFNPVNEILNASNDAEKYNIYQTYIPDLEGLHSNILGSSYMSSKEILLPLTEKIINSIKEYVFKQGKSGANIILKKVSKNYPFYFQNDLNLLIRIINNGDSYANFVSCTFDSKHLSINKSSYEYENFAPGDIVVDIPVTVTSRKIVKNPKITATLNWKNFDGSTHEAKEEFSFESQDENVPWDELFKKSPYSLKAVEEKTKLLGRDEIIEELSVNINNPSFINSYILYGQKRVGKTSIVKTIRNLFNSQKENHTVVSFVDITLVRSSKAEDTISELVKRTCMDLKKVAINKFKDNSILVSAIQAVLIPVHNPSLIVLRDFIDELQSIIPELRVIIIIDEFDEMNFDIYKPGEVSETFFRNFRGLNNEYDSVAFILVGAENMPKIYTWHGDILNNWKNRAIDTFSPAQFDLYRKVIEVPVSPYIKYSDNSIKTIYDLCEGNPYFTKMICKWIFDSCYIKKDSEVTTSDVENVIDSKLKDEAKTSFQHYWKDGILDSSEKREFIADLRKHTLLAFAKACSVKSDFDFESSIITLKEIERHFPNIDEISNPKEELKKQLNEFRNRKIIFQDAHNNYYLKPKIFLLWLVRYGLNEIIEGSVDKELLLKEKQEEEKLKLTDDELRKAVASIKYQSKTLSYQNLKQWLEQIPQNSVKRIFYDVFNKLIYISDALLTDYFRQIKTQIYSGTSINLKSSRKFKRNDSLLVVPKRFFNENNLFAKQFASSAYISPSDTKKNDHRIEIKSSHRFVIFIFPILDSHQDIISELDHFKAITKISDTADLKLIIIPIIAVNDQLSILNESLSSFKNTTIITPLKSIDANSAAIFHQSSIFFNDLISKSHAKDFISNYTDFELDESHLGILFEKICPQRTLPIFWCQSSEWKPIFLNEYEIELLKNIDPGFKDQAAEQRRNECSRIGSALERRMLEIVKQTLINKYGDENKNWWVSGVPQNIRTDCSRMWELDDRVEEEESYLYFINFVAIAKKNPELQSYFYDQSSGSVSPTAWLDKLNAIRNKYSHPNKTAPTQEDLQYLIEHNKRFLKRISKLS